MKIGVLGDIMPSGVLVGENLILSSSLKEYLGKFDVRIGTLECAVGSTSNVNVGKYKDNKEVCVWVQPESLIRLRDLNVNIVSLANNHIGDLGKEGLIKSMELLDELSIKYCGAGLNEQEASKPVVLEYDGKKFAFIAVCQKNKAFLGSVQYADNNNWGVFGYDDKVVSYIKTLKKEYDHVFVIAHWGVEFKWLPDEVVCEYAKAMIDAGADGIIGGHPHQIQPLLTYKERPIYYSLGNFLFPEMYIDDYCNVFYPSKKEGDKLPRFERFPIGRNFSMKYYWTSMGRKSMIADISINDGRVRATYSLTKLNKFHLSLNRSDFLLRGKIVVCGILYQNLNKKLIKKLNRSVSILKFLYFYKIKALFNSKYRFYKYVKKIN